MKRWLYAYRHVAGAPDALEEALLQRGPELLRTATDSPETRPAGDGSILIQVRSSVAGIELAKAVRLTTGVARREGSRIVLPVSWRADGASGVFPAFSGSLELQPLSAATAQLTLVGSYQVPLGPIGAAADATALRNVGQSTADTIVRRLAGELGRTVAAPQATVTLIGPRSGEALLVRDVMSEDPLIFDEDLPLRTAALLLFHSEIAGAPVMSKDGDLIGVLSEGDLLAKEASRLHGLTRQAAEEERRRRSRTVGEACTRPAKTTVPDARLTDVARTMLDQDVNRLVVIDEGRIAGIISRHDLLAGLIRTDAEIEQAVRKVVSAYAGDKVEVSVEWGIVVLTGETDLRSRAERLPAAVDDVDGVMDVDARDVRWRVDDISPAYARL